jgi:hypothetical protein
MKLKHRRGYYGRNCCSRSSRAAYEKPDVMRKAIDAETNLKSMLDNGLSTENSMKKCKSGIRYSF